MRIMSKPSVERIFVAGHRGMVGSALVRALRERGDCQLILRSRDELDLSDAAQVDAFFSENDIDTVYLAAARVGGIHANHSYPAEFIRTNLQIETNVIHHAWRYQVKRLLFLGSSCIYPRNAPQPMREEYLLSGVLEPTNEPYAVAKIAGIKLCESYNRQYGTDFRSIMPTNLYGPGDNFHAQDSHVLPALIRRFHEAQQTNQPEVQVWGSGEALREFLYVDDMAQACLWLMDQPREALDKLTSPQCSHFNAGSGEEIRIASLAMQVAEVMSYEGHIVFDRSKPDGAPRKLLDSTRLRSLGWEPLISLQEGMQRTAEDFLAGQAANPMIHIFSDTRDGRRTRDIPRLRL
jgi:GDP-L-fucose synthase